MKGPMIVEEGNLSVAWGKAFLEAFQANEITPLVVVIKNFDNGWPSEVATIRQALDLALEYEGKGLSLSYRSQHNFSVNLEP